MTDIKGTALTDHVCRICGSLVKPVIQEISASHYITKDKAPRGEYALQKRTHYKCPNCHVMYDFDNS